MTQKFTFTAIIQNAGGGGAYKEYAAWIDEAKKNETRQKRIARTIEMLKQKKKAGS